VHEALDTKFCRLDEHENSLYNLATRFILRALFFSINTLSAAMFPFLGDFVTLVGSLSLIPLTFVFPSLVFLKVILMIINTSLSLHTVLMQEIGT
jgi:hypothetical protein